MAKSNGVTSPRLEYRTHSLFHERLGEATYRIGSWTIPLVRMLPAQLYMNLRT